ncbi:MAG: hypothetical protein AB1726_08835 [Planctomycetota bacterium]
MKPAALPFVLSAGLLVLAGFAPAAASQEGGTSDAGAGAVRYGRIAVAGVQVKNLPDIDGASIASPARGTIVAIHDEMAGWYGIEIPGGYAVWVFGRYLRAVAGEERVWEVTRNAVNMRPAPKSDVLSFPLPQRLHSGDRVRGIEILDPAADLAETWVRIWSPPGVRAWVRVAEVAPLAAGEDGLALWSAAAAGLAERVPPPYVRPAPEAGGGEIAAAKPAEAAAKVEESEAVRQARAGLEEARRRLETEKAKESPDFAPVRTELEAFAAAAPTGDLAARARAELERLAFYEDVARMQGELRRERERLAAEAQRREQEAWEASLAKDPLGHVFASRGVLVREIDAAGAPRYLLRFGKEFVSEVVCTSGRYDLDAFAGYEIGVQGETLQTTGSVLDALVIDAARVEVTARR